MATSPISLALLLLVSSGALTSPSPSSRFDALSDRAQPLDSLGQFLERYVGRCDDPLTRADCEQNVRAVRRTADEKAYRARLAEQTMEVVRPERVAGGYRFVVTPFIDGGGVALTNGEPRRQDATGRPLVGLLVIDAALPAGSDDVERALRTGRLELEVVFRPQGTWRLKRKDAAGFYEGVKARFLAIRLVESRTGAEIASKVLGP